MVSETFPPLAENLTDFNDLAAAEGLEAVRELIDQAAPAAPAAPAWPMPTIGGTAPPDLQADVLPGVVGEYVGKHCDSLQVPATMGIGMALSVLAVCAQRRYTVEVHEGYFEPASLWTATLAVSGSRKTAVKNGITFPLDGWEHVSRERMRREIAANNATISVAEARIKRLELQAGKSDDAEERESLRKLIADEKANMPDRMFPPCAYLNDATVERLQMVLVEQGGRAGVLADEAAILNTLASNYGGAGGPALDVLLSGHSGSDVRVERASRSAYVKRSAVTMGLMLQPDLLNEVAGSNKFKASGLLARLLYFVPRPFVGGRDVRRFSKVPPELRDRYARCIDELMPNPMDGAHLPPASCPCRPRRWSCGSASPRSAKAGLPKGAHSPRYPIWAQSWQARRRALRCCLSWLYPAPSRTP